MTESISLDTWASGACCRIAIHSCWSTACWSASRARASGRIKNVTANEPFFPGHFPHRPVMPGVMIIEALAQTAGLLAFITADVVPDDSTRFFFVGIDKARFRKPVEPGDQLILTAKLERAHARHLEVHDRRLRGRQ